MIYDDRAAYLKAHSNPLRLSRKQRLENLIEVRRINSCPRISDRHIHKTWFETVRLHAQGSHPTRTHSLDRIYNEVQNHLLQLDFVAHNDCELVVELYLQVYACGPQIHPNNR